MDARRIEEAFEVLGKKSAAVDKVTLGVIMRSLGMNPTNEEIGELYSSAAGEHGIELEGCVKCAMNFESNMKAKSTDDEYALHQRKHCRCACS